MTEQGPLAFVGGGEWHRGCTFDRRLLEASGVDEVVVLPAAAAFERPEKVIELAKSWFGDLGVSVKVLDVLNRRQAESDEAIDAVRSCRFLYIADGSPLHLRSVVKGSKFWDALVDAWRGGAVIAGSSAGATLLGDPMVDPRGGAFTLGLGLVSHLAIVPNWERWTGDRARRMEHLMPKGAVVAEVPEQTALIRWPSGTWEVEGAGAVTLTLNHKPLPIEALESNIEILGAPAR